MRNLIEDINKDSAWISCTWKAKLIKITYNENGALYKNLLDGEVYTADKANPIVVHYGKGVCWTCSLDTLMEDYLTEEGMPIDGKFIDELIAKGQARVHTNTDRDVEAFHVSTEQYGYNCLDGVNSAHRYISDGDYLIRQGRVRTRAMSNQLFRALYSERRI